MADPDRWQHRDGVYFATNEVETSDLMKPGMYDPGVTQEGRIYFSPVDQRNDALLRFPNSISTKIVDEISLFWERERAFRDHDIPFKRGILLHGPPGSGKSSTLRQITQDVIEHGGVVMQFANPRVFVDAFRVFRMIQSDTPVVVTMEDLDTILERGNESYIMNMLDGIELVEKVVFLATTNYPEKLSARIGNRPSRFDRLYFIGHPNQPARRMYLESLLLPGDDVDLDQWARDTKGLSIAHLKELFVGVVVLGGEYAEVLKLMKGMKQIPKSTDEGYDDEDEVLVINTPMGPMATLRRGYA